MRVGVNAVPEEDRLLVAPLRSQFGQPFVGPQSVELPDKDTKGQQRASKT